MRRLARPAEDLGPHVPVVVVGSGYGGAVCAARLALAGHRVAVLERGREHLPGEFPETANGLRRALQTTFAGAHLGRRDALFDLHLDADVSALAGCGLGGGSLINGAVALRPHPDVFADARWPAGLRADLDTVRRGYFRAEQMLRPAPYPMRDPDGRPMPALPKLDALAAAARRLDAPYARAPAAIRWFGGPSPGGVLQSACTLCGDCVSGCNRGAKNTLTVNYLPLARSAGATLYTGVEVERLAPAPEGWRLHLRPVDGPRRTMTARRVILAAGTLGSTGILLRSREAGLPLSERLGERFSMNGDILGFAYDTAWETRSVGFGDRPGGAPVGPTIGGMLDLRDAGLVVQEGAIPGPLAALLPALLALAAEPATDAFGALRRTARSWGEALAGPQGEAVGRTLVLLVSSIDPAAGRITFEDGHLRLRWPGAGEAPWVREVHARLEAIAGALSGRFLPNPTWRDLRRKPLLTTHPLGGCAMADDASGGVVDHLHRVFDGRDPTSVHPGLAVCDGAVVPRALGANPLLTIAALAERLCERMAD